MVVYRIGEILKNIPIRKVEDKDGQWHNKNHTPKERGTCMDKILIVEDSMELLDGLYRNLQEESFAVYAASCLTEARKYLDSGIDLCLPDLNLPDGDGLTFCRYLSENTAIPVILLTVRDDAQDMVQGLSMGADDYVTIVPMEQYYSIIGNFCDELEVYNYRNHVNYVVPDGMDEEIQGKAERICNAWLSGSDFMTSSVLTRS